MRPQMACISHANLAMIDQEPRAIIKQAVYRVLVFNYIDGALMKEIGEIACLYMILIFAPIFTKSKCFLSQPTDGDRIQK
jgi:hypothetical protein